MALSLLTGIAILELFEIADHAIEIAAHLLDLRGDRSALRGERREKCEESLAGAAGFAGLRNGAIEIGLLFGNGVLGALDLFGAHWVRAVSWLSSRTQAGFELGAGLAPPGFEIGWRAGAGVASPGGGEMPCAFAATGKQTATAANRIANGTVCRRTFRPALMKPLTR